MKHKFIVTTAVLLAALMCIFCAGCTCSPDDGNKDAANSTLPTEYASIGPDVTDQQDSTFAPTDAASTDGPASTDTPEQTQTSASTEPYATNPADTGDPGNTSNPNATPSAITTDTPSNTSVPGITTHPIDPTPSPTTPPSDTVVSGLVWLDGKSTVSYDMDGDGKAEKVKVIVTEQGSSKRVTISITVGSSGNVLTTSINADSFLSAFINTFNSSRAHLVVSTCVGSRQHSINCYRMNSSSTSLDSFGTDGWIEAVNGNKLLVGRLYDVMGTWECTSEFSFNASGTELVQDGEFWDVVREGERWCTVRDIMLVGLYTTGPDNETTFLTEGYQLYPIRTDMKTLIDIVLDTGAPGYMQITLDSNGAPIYAGATMDELFSDLTYIR